MGDHDRYIFIGGPCWTGELDYNYTGLTVVPMKCNIFHF